MKYTFKDENNKIIESISDSEAMAAITQFNGGNPFAMGQELNLLFGYDVKTYQLRNFETYYYKNTMAHDGYDNGKNHDFNSETIYYLSELR